MALLCSIQGERDRRKKVLTETLLLSTTVIDLICNSVIQLSISQLGKIVDWVVPESVRMLL